MRPEHGAATGPGLETLEDVLLESVVGAALWWHAEDVASPRIGGEGFAVPLFDGVRWIGQHHVEAPEAVAFHELRLGQGVAALNVEILDAVEEAVHPGDGTGHQVALLAVEPHIAPLFLQIAEVRDAGEQHSAGAAGGVVDALTRLHVEHLGHQVNDGAVRVKLGGGVAGVVGKLFDEEFVSLAKFVLGQVGDGELKLGEVLDQIAQHGVGEPVLVGPLSIAEDAVELVRVGRFDGTHGRLEGAAYVSVDLADFVPVSIGRHLEAVVFREQCKVLVPAGITQGSDRFLVEYVAEAFVEEQREDELLVVARVDGSPEEHSRAPEVGFELLLGDTIHPFALLEFAFFLGASPLLACLLVRGFFVNLPDRSDVIYGKCSSQAALSVTSKSSSGYFVWT